MAYHRFREHRPSPASGNRILPPTEVDARLGKPPLVVPPVPETDLSAGAIEARRLLEVARQKYMEQQEKNMPDMKSEMSKVIQAWDDEPAGTSQGIASGLTGHTVPLERVNVSLIPTPAPSNVPKAAGGKHFAPTNNISRATFDLIRDNKDKYTSAEAARVLERMGYKYSSSTSILSMMVKQGCAGRNSNGTLYTRIPEYVPLKSGGAARALPKAKAKPKPAPKPVHDGPKKEAKPVPAPPPMTFAPMPPAPTVVMTAANVLQQMGIAEAHALYVELHRMFGGK